ncbi:MAG: hypothetical protein EBS60_03820 [Verrucomicrobia bacterium]|nr:hypothetical protein [Verrucomicrobiota bacterium]
MSHRAWILCLFTPLLFLLFPCPLLSEEAFEKKPESLLPLTPHSGWENTSAKEWAKLLNLPTESDTKYQSSYRIYIDQGFELLGACPKSISLIASEDHPDQLTIMFANKGDSASSYLRTNSAANASLKDITDVKRLIQADYDILKKNISEQLGKPTTQGFGEAGKAREFPLRWDYQGTAFLLTERPGEYCVLRILPSSSADQGGKTSRISDSAMRERMKNNVVHRPNGDVIIENIPMVDQGPKGFCVPATYTRVLLYAGVPADLYLLALLGHTDVGGGTSGIAMENSARALAASYGRSIASIPPTLDLPKLETFFEKGIPLTWAMFIDEKLDRDLSSRLQQRTGADLDAWLKTLAEKRKDARSIKKNLKNAHACLLIGLNRKTGELATSDSWGPEFAERWITIEEARAISQGDLGAIVP